MVRQVCSSVLIVWLALLQSRLVCQSRVPVIVPRHGLSQEHTQILSSSYNRKNRTLSS